MQNRRSPFKFVAALAVCTALGSASAQGFPTRPIQMVVPYAAGGTGDLTARLLAEAMGRHLNQTVVVDNKPGAGGAIGTSQVLSTTKADGYTLLFVAPGVFSVVPQLVKVSYSTDDMRALGVVSRTPQLVSARKGSKFDTLAGFLSAAQANPGTITVGYGGIGTPNHLALVNLELTANIKLIGVAYRGSAPMLQDLLGGQIEMGVDQVSSSKQYIESGALVPIAVFGPPVSWLPGLPSLSSVGTEALDVTSYLGVVVPKGTPDPVFETLRAALEKAVGDPVLKVTLEKVGSSPYYRDGKEFENIIRKETVFIKRLVDNGTLKHE